MAAAFLPSAKSCWIYTTGCQWPKFRFWDTSWMWNIKAQAGGKEPRPPSRSDSFVCGNKSDMNLLSVNRPPVWVDRSGITWHWEFFPRVFLYRDGVALHSIAYVTFHLKILFRDKRQKQTRKFELRRRLFADQIKISLATPTSLWPSRSFKELANLDTAAVSGRVAQRWMNE